MPDVVADGVANSVVEEVADSVVVVKEVVEETDLEEVARVVHSDVDVVDSVSSTTADTEVKAPSTEHFVNIGGGFPGGPIDQSMLTEYVDHVALRLWQGDVYVFYV